MAIDEVLEAYGAQAEGIVKMLGTEVLADDPDQVVVESWARTVDGKILDVGSGTGRWSGYLTNLGHSIEGLEPVTELVETAQRAHPSVPFRVAPIADLDHSIEQWSGILAWYTLIHLNPTELLQALKSLRRALKDDGSMLFSIFSGPRLEQFNHPIAPAYRWPLDEITPLLNAAGFELVFQLYDPPAPHAIILAKAISNG